MENWKRTQGTTRCNHLMSARKVLWNWLIPEDAELRCIFTTRWIYVGNPKECIRRCELHYGQEVWAQKQLEAMLDWLSKQDHFVMPYIPLLTPWDLEDANDRIQEGRPLQVSVRDAGESSQLQGRHGEGLGA